MIVAALVASAHAERSLDDYRYFRALTIDFVGRPPTASEIVAFERPEFRFDQWIDRHLAGKRYAERIRNVYNDRLRLDLPLGAAPFKPPPVMLRWTSVMGPDGKVIDLYFRDGQRRTRPDLDGQVCFSTAETGLVVGPDGPPVGKPKRVSQKLLNARTVVIRPWWLYADYRAAKPRDRAGPVWQKRYGFELEWSMFTEPDGKTPMTGIRVCREEAQTAPTGRVFVTGRVARKGDPIPPGRQTRLPADTAFATAHKGEVVSCTSKAGFESSVDCGCGMGLERCMPTEPNGFVMPWSIPLGVDQPFDAAPRPGILWLRTWWAEEAKRVFDRVFEQDRDIRELLTSRGTVINGPLAQFYRYFANATCCGDSGGSAAASDVLFDPSKVPSAVAPYEVNKWVEVSDRGPHAAGILTLPVFLLKYGSQRQRAHAIYNAFTCKDFVAETAKLEPSSEPDLTKRPGCSACHQRLEPMAAYFARVQESDWSFIPASQFPAVESRCTSSAAPVSACKTVYDPVFTNSQRAVLRGAYASVAHADLGPQGLAAEITSSNDFAPCAVRTIATALLGRPLAVADNAWKMQLAQDFAARGYRMRELVRAIVTSDLYRGAAAGIVGETKSAANAPAAASIARTVAVTSAPAAGTVAVAAAPAAGPVAVAAAPGADPVAVAAAPPGSLIAAAAQSSPRMVPPEAFLRAYLAWFGSEGPYDVFLRARGDDLFDRWPDYLAALGLPEYHVDAPRLTRSNTVLRAAVGRLGEALCARAAQHDLHDHAPADKRMVFAFDVSAAPTRAQFATAFDGLHRTFLGYPSSLAPRHRVDRFFDLYRRIAADRDPKAALTADETAWVGVCTALVQHPEASVY